MKFGIVGTGMIAKMMLPEFARCDKFEAHAVCSRKEETGRALAEAFSIPKVYTEFADMLADPEIEMVYVATPNHMHYQQAKAALEAGKHVVCEKPFTPYLAEAEELIALAKEKGLLLYEAITTAHHPAYQYIKEQLPRIGEVKVAMGVFCQFSSRYPALMEGKVAPVFMPEYKGGALMDINLYNIHFLVGLFGEPEKVQYFPNCHTNGIDTSGVLVLQYPGFVCQCVGAKDSAADNRVEIAGDKGTMLVTPAASTCTDVVVKVRGAETEQGHWPENPWHYEVQDLGRCFETKDYEGCYKLLEATRNVVAVLEEGRRSANLCF